MNVLFVCTANICRSAMSAAIFKKTIAEMGIQDTFIVDSAGTEALVEAPPDDTTTAVCETHDIDITSHRSQQVTDTMIRDASIVLCMAEPHRRIIRGIFPQWESKILMLKEFGQPQLPANQSVEDPTGRSKKKYDQCFKELESEITRILPILQGMASQSKSA
jgi:protein-tyrosine-phosphatase